MNASKNRIAQIVKSGTWLYDQTVPHEIWIVRQNFDYYYEEGFENGPEDLNEDGFVFHVVHAFAGQVRSVMRAHKTLEDATQEAEKVTSGIHWDNHRLHTQFDGRNYKLHE